MGLTPYVSAKYQIVEYLSRKSEGNYSDYSFLTAQRLRRFARIFDV